MRRSSLDVLGSRWDWEPGGDRDLSSRHVGSLAVEAGLKSSGAPRLSEVVRQLAIGEVAERAGMSASRIRYYEARGLLPEPERAAGKRRYAEDVFPRLAIIDAAQRVGFTLEEIRCT